MKENGTRSARRRTLEEVIWNRVTTKGETEEQAADLVLGAMRDGRDGWELVSFERRQRFEGGVCSAFGRYVYERVVAGQLEEGHTMRFLDRYEVAR